MYSLNFSLSRLKSAMWLPATKSASLMLNGVNRSQKRLAVGKFKLQSKCSSSSWNKSYCFYGLNQPWITTVKGARGCCLHSLPLMILQGVFWNNNKTKQLLGWLRHLWQVLAIFKLKRSQLVSWCLWLHRKGQRR